MRPNIYEAPETQKDHKKKIGKFRKKTKGSSKGGRNAGEWLRGFISWRALKNFRGAQARGQRKKNDVQSKQKKGQASGRRGGGFVGDVDRRLSHLGVVE